MSIIVENNSKDKKPVQQIDNNNLLYDLAKVNCKLTFFHKEKDFTFYENFKRLLSTNINTTTTLSPEGKRLYYYVKYYEGNDSEKYSFSEISILKDMNICLFITIDELEIRQEIFNSYKKIIKNLNDPNYTRSRLIFLFDGHTPKNPKEFYEEKGVYFIKRGKENIIKEMNVIVSDLVINGYVKFIDEINRNVLQSKFTNKNLETVKKIIGYLIQIQDFDTLLKQKIIEKAINNYSGIESAKFEEIKGLVLFYKDMYDIKLNENKFKFNDNIINLIDNACLKYKKDINKNLQIEAILRILNYFTYFCEDEDLKKKFEEYVQKLLLILHNIKNDKIGRNDDFINFLRLSELYNKMKMIRKSNHFYCKAFLICNNTKELKNMLPSMIKKISDAFNLYDVSSNLFDSYEDFLNVHQYIILNFRKPICFYLFDQEKEDYFLSLKKKFDKTNKISIRNNLSIIKKYIFFYFWKALQKELNSKIINYYNDENNPNKSIKYSFGKIQTFLNNIDESITFDNELNDHSKISNKTQEKVFLNLSKIPFLMRIIPIPSDTKLDISPNINKKKVDKQIFLFNPWENKNKIDYYWTENSYQKIKVELYNPFPFILNISKIRICYKGIKLLNYPINVKINANSTFMTVCNIKLKQSGILNILGIQYEIENSVAVQYCDNNGNGLFYQFENVLFDPMSALKKSEKTYLHNIFIHPEIELLTYQILDNSFQIINGAVNLFEYQYYTFSFLLENVGIYDINELHCVIFCYKKNNYKLTLEEIIEKVEIKPNQKYIFNYKYWHRCFYVKIEFRLFYKSIKKSQKSEIEDDFIVKPYLFYSKNLQYKHLIDFEEIDKMIKPNIDDISCSILCKNDKRIKISFIELMKDDKKLIKPYIQYIKDKKKVDIKNLEITIKDIEEKMVEIEKKLECYKYTYCSEKSKLILGIKNIQLSPIQIHFKERISGKILNKEICDVNESKNISCEIDSKIDFENIGLEWNLIKMDNVYGEILLSQIFDDIKFKEQLKLINTFKLNIDIIKQNDISGNEYLKTTFSILNQTKEEKKNLRILIYIYQNYYDEKKKEIYFSNDNEIDKIIIEGDLSIIILKLESNKTFEYDIKIYPNSNDKLKVSFLVIDHINESIFLCPFSKDININ